MENATVDRLIAAAKKQGQGRIGFLIVGLEQSEAFRSVVARFAAGDAPPVFEFPATLGAPFDENEQVHQTALLAYMLQQFRSRVDVANRSPDERYSVGKRLDGETISLDEEKEEAVVSSARRRRVIRIRPM